MTHKTIAAAGIAVLTLGFAGVTTVAADATPPSTNTHACQNAKAAAAHARNDARKAAHALTVANHKLAAASKTHDKAALAADRAARKAARAADRAAEKALVKANAKKRHNCTTTPAAGTPVA